MGGGERSGNEDVQGLASRNLSQLLRVRDLVETTEGAKVER